MKKENKIEKNLFNRKTILTLIICSLLGSQQIFALCEVNPAVERECPRPLEEAAERGFKVGSPAPSPSALGRASRSPDSPASPRREATELYGADRNINPADVFIVCNPGGGISADAEATCRKYHDSQYRCLVVSKFRAAILPGDAMPPAPAGALERLCIWNVAPPPGVPAGLKQMNMERTQEHKAPKRPIKKKTTP